MAKYSPWRVSDVQDTPTSLRRKHREQLQRDNEYKQICCWPKCETPLWSEIPLCSAHLDIASKMGQRLAKGEEVVFRAQVVVSPEPAKEPQVRDGFVYYLRSSGYLKIGWTADLSKRMKGYPPDSMLLAVEPGPRQLETRRHKQFAHHRTHGREWYTMAPTLMHHIGSVKAEHGEPPSVDFAAKPVGIPQPRQRETIGRPARGVRHVSG